MSVNGGAVRRNRAGSTTHVDENGTTHITYPQTLLLQTVASWPALRRLTISAAETKYQRGWWAVIKLDHRGAVNAAIVNAVEGFRTDVPGSTARTKPEQGQYSINIREAPSQNLRGGSPINNRGGSRIKSTRPEWHLLVTNYPRLEIGKTAHKRPTRRPLCTGAYDEVAVVAGREVVSDAFEFSLLVALSAV
ncbi:hypothetical protein C8R45DRAFT_933522 [Mycena sanguinolenta]|nr:hypothetical protein C8R45DRAFT_933522 [Mycena sanguinolenta]